MLDEAIQDEAANAGDTIQDEIVLDEVSKTGKSHP